MALAAKCRSLVIASWNVRLVSIQTVDQAFTHFRIIQVLKVVRLARERRVDWRRSEETSAEKIFSESFETL